MERAFDFFTAVGPGAATVVAESGAVRRRAGGVATQWGSGSAAGCDVEASDGIAQRGSAGDAAG